MILCQDIDYDIAMDTNTIGDADSDTLKGIILGANWLF